MSSFWTLKPAAANRERLFAFSYVCAPKYFLNKYPVASLNKFLKNQNCFKKCHLQQPQQTKSNITRKLMKLFEEKENVREK